MDEPNLSNPAPRCNNPAFADRCLENFAAENVTLRARIDALEADLATSRELTHAALDQLHNATLRHDRLRDQAIERVPFQLMGGFSLDEGYAEWVAEQAKVEEAERKSHLVVMDDAWWKAMTDKAKGGTLRG